MQSNINITSNIYVRREPELRRDLEYTSQITGAKRLKDIQKRYYGMERIRLTEAQEKLISGSERCLNAKSGEQSYGVIRKDGKLAWSCRCEQQDCSLYAECMRSENAKKIFRNSQFLAAEDAKEAEEFQAFVKSLGITIQNHEVEFERDKHPMAQIAAEMQADEYEKPEELPVSELQQESSRYTKLTEPRLTPKSCVNLQSSV